MLRELHWHRPRGGADVWYGWLSADEQERVRARAERKGRGERSLLERRAIEFRARVSRAPEMMLRKKSLDPLLVAGFSFGTPPPDAVGSYLGRVSPPMDSDSPPAAQKPEQAA